MTQDNSGRDLNDFEARLKKAQATQTGYKAANAPKLRSESSGFGQAFRIGAELISALLVGVGLGWFLDSWLDTKPILMITFIFLGGAAGILNVYRTAMRMAEEVEGTAEQGSGNDTGADSGPEGRKK